MKALFDKTLFKFVISVQCWRSGNAVKVAVATRLTLNQLFSLRNLRIRIRIPLLLLTFKGLWLKLLIPALG